MMKRVRSLLLCLMMVFLAVAGDISTVQAGTNYEDFDTASTLDKVGLPKDAVTLLDVTPSEDPINILELVAGGTNTTFTDGSGSVDMEIGKTIYLGVKVDPTKFTGHSTDPQAYVQSIRAQLAFYECTNEKKNSDLYNSSLTAATAKYEETPYTNYFEQIQAGDVFAVDKSVTSDTINSMAFKYSRGWDGEDYLRLTVTDPSNSPLSSTETVLVIRLKVKKAIDRYCKFELKNVAVMGDKNLFVDSKPYDTTNCAKTERALTNTKYGSRKVALYRTANNDTGDLSVPKGKDVSVPLYVGENDGFASMKITATISNTSSFKFSGVKLSSEARIYTDLTVDSITDDTIKLSLTSAKDIKLSNKTKLLDFVVNAYGSTGDTDVNMLISGVGNESGTKMGLELDGTSADNNGTVTRHVKMNANLMYGDLDGNGDVNLVDAAILLQYYNGVRSLSELQIELADVNGSKSITLVDVLLIMQYYNENQGSATRPSGWAKNTDGTVRTTY